MESPRYQDPRGIHGWFCHWHFEPNILTLVEVNGRNGRDNKWRLLERLEKAQGAMSLRGWAVPGSDLLGIVWIAADSRMVGLISDLVFTCRVLHGIEPCIMTDSEALACNIFCLCFEALILAASKIQSTKPNNNTRRLLVSIQEADVCRTGGGWTIKATSLQPVWVVVGYAQPRHRSTIQLAVSPGFYDSFLLAIIDMLGIGVKA